jgi:transposase-like protein
VLVSEQSGSGKSVAAFCRERGVPASQMFSWKKRFREAAAAKFVEVAVKPQLETAPAVSARGSGIEVRLSGGRSLFVEPGFNANHLRLLLGVLENPA